jgi:hypothetical protein
MELSKSKKQQKTTNLEVRLDFVDESKSLYGSYIHSSLNNSTPEINLEKDVSRLDHPIGKFETLEESDLCNLLMKPYVNGTLSGFTISYTSTSNDDCDGSVETAAAKLPICNFRYKTIPRWCAFQEWMQFINKNENGAILRTNEFDRIRICGDYYEFMEITAAAAASTTFDDDNNIKGLNLKLLKTKVDKLLIPALHWANVYKLLKISV